jgi:smad nuclear-interacting protein 1
LKGSTLKLWRPEPSASTNSAPLPKRKLPDDQLTQQPARPIRSSSSSSSSSSNEEIVKKQLPDFKPSGKLAAAAMQKNGVTLKYAEPATARVAPSGWRLYEFKGEEQLETIKLAGKSAFLVGRDERVCELTALHPSVSSQHAVVQFREVERRTSGVREVVPAILDLKSTNGTFLNGTRIQDSIYIELKQQDVLRFGESSREYVLIKE